MKSRILIFGFLLFTILVWPPIYSIYLDRDFKTWLTGRGRMEDFELQQLLGAQRWVIDIPPDRTGWVLGLETEIEGKVKSGGGSSVTGGTRIILMTRRNQSTKRIEYSWYQTESTRSTETDGPVTITLNLTSSGSGSVEDPLVSAGVTSGRPDGTINSGEPIYRGGHSSVAGFPSTQKADYEVRVVLSPPFDPEKDRTKGWTEVLDPGVLASPRLLLALGHHSRSFRPGILVRNPCARWR